MPNSVLLTSGSARTGKASCLKEKLHFQDICVKSILSYH